MGYRLVFITPVLFVIKLPVVYYKPIMQAVGLIETTGVLMKTRMKGVLGWVRILWRTHF